MRIRATVAAVSGALALSALAVPAAQAVPQGDKVPSKSTADERWGVSPGKSSVSGVRADELPTVSKVTINGGKNIVVGTTYAKTFTVSVTASHPNGIADAYIDLWHGQGPGPGEYDGALVSTAEAADCTAASATTSTCKLSITAAPGVDLYANLLAGTWHVTTGVLSGGDEPTVYWNDYQATHRVQRNSTLTVNASPEPVRKDRTITITGKLARANWEDFKYHGYTVQPVKLQFRKAGTNTYTTLKTIKTNSTGNLSTTVKASTDGYFRYSFAGTSTTPAITTAGDFVDVQ